MLVHATLTLAEKIDALLPQTQCTQCGYPGCMPYAEAIAAGEADINRCPPGGDTGINALATLLARKIIALDTTRGAHLPHRVAIIDEEICIGCGKCLRPCPTDAIIGTNKYMHTVIASLCTGCELCIPPCPVDCIRMEQNSAFPAMMDADDARARYSFHQSRLAREAHERNAALETSERAALHNNGAR
jgi:Na+-translocating ferredoxin:NAD+ oxidoreductase subunit B